MAILTGWTDEYILKMPARRFFIMQEKLRLVDYRRHSWVLRELCYVAWVPNADKKYLEELVKGYGSKLTNVKPRTRKDVMDLKDPVMFAAFASPFIQKRKLMGFH